MTELDLRILAGGAPGPGERDALLAAGRTLLGEERAGGDRARPSPYASGWRAAGLAERLAPPAQPRGAGPPR